MIALWLCLSSAFAARHELTFEMGTTVVSDDAAQTWFSAGGTPQLGLRAGGAVLRHPTGVGLVVGGAWGRSTTRQNVSSYAAWDNEDAWDASMDTRLIIDRFGLGLRADYDVRGFFFPLVRAEARLAVLSSTLSPATYDASSEPIEVKHVGVAPGGRFTAGFEFLVPDRALPVTVGFSLEAGYEVNGNARLGEMGTINPSGPVVTAGLGLRL